LFSGNDVFAAALALVLHALVALALVMIPPMPSRAASSVEVDVRRREAPPVKVETPPAPEKKEEPPPPPRKLVQKLKPHAPPPQPVAPPPNATPPKDPPKDPPKPVFGVTMSSTVDGEANMAVNVGNTTMIDPKKSAKTTGPVMPLPAAPAPPPKPSYAPVGDLYIRSMPEIDNDACGHSVDYPPEAEQLGIEGTVRLRIELDERGKVHAVRVLSGLGHGLDEAAMHALKHKCKFTPAIATDGKPVPYVISEYQFHFEIPR
jgi:periplasmic protein TonB